MTVNRFCGSGAQAIVSAAHEILSGAVESAVAGGMENMHLAPYLIARGRWGYRARCGSGTPVERGTPGGGSYAKFIGLSAIGAR